MYCPKCSQQQVSEEVRFCSRCGFQLSAVRELIASDGALETLEVKAPGRQLAPSLRGVRQGAWMMLASLPAALVVAFLAGVVDDALAVLLLLPLICFVAGFLRLLYATFLTKRAPHENEDAAQPHITSRMPAQMGAAARSPELPPSQASPVAAYSPPGVKTAEMAQPPSVTESTTRLLDEETAAHRE